MRYTDQQKKVIESTAPLIFCCAGAGSGKSTTLAERIRYTISNGVPAKSVVAITFTTMAARELQKKLEGIDLCFCGTLHSFLLRLLRQNAAVIGYKSNINVLDEESSAEFVEKFAEEHRYKGTKESLKDAIAEGPPKPNERFTKERLVAAAFYKSLKSNNLMTFDAILIYGLILLSKIEQKIMHWYVDEVQDSSRLDFQIYNALVGYKFFTGDDSQAIYGWRGGDVSQCLSLAKTATVIPLEDNFRCGSAICDAAQALIEKNTARYPKVTRSATGFRGSVEVRCYENAAVEAAGIANTIANSDVDRKDIAVLLRTNDLVKEYADHLRAVGIPVAERVVKERPADWWKAKLLLAFLANPDDDYVAFQWARCLCGEQLAQALLKDARAKFQTINQFQTKIPSPFPLQNLGQMILDYNVSAESWGHILPHFDALADNPDATVSDLILALGSTDHGEEIGEGVVVTTCHAAKGREFSMVFIPCAEEDFHPGCQKSVDVQESRRLFYVAMTRAKNSLIISWSKVRVKKWGRMTPVATVPSRFIKEAGL